MRKMDMSDIYDSCYSDYDDYTAELVLEWDARSEEWRDDSVKFYKTESYGWAFEKTAGGWNYGYDTLEEAVTEYTCEIATESAVDKYSASRLFDKQYDHRLNQGTSDGHIYCKVTKRMFKGKRDYRRARLIKDTLSDVLDRLAS